MPMREFKCELGHTTELYLVGEDDRRTKFITCEHPEIVAEDDGEILKYCKRDAARVGISTTGNPQFVRGCGGFYRPTK